MDRECPMCGRALYVEESTNDYVCPACCSLRAGECYHLASLSQPQ